jgi:16S rRNA (cytosine1402-N4)-methyltransferase
MVVHKPVLFKESIDGLNLKKDSIVVDATLGGGGHSYGILQVIEGAGKLVAIDQDSSAIENFRQKFPEKNVELVQDNFSNIKEILIALKIDAVSGILADLGYSSIQLEDEKYGMSFLKDAPLDMRLNRSSTLTAEKIVNEYDQRNLERIFREYGEEKFAGVIAKKIVSAREEKKIESTFELVEIIRQAIPERFQHQKIHPATKIFQALRIEVNQELENLKKFIPAAIDVLKSGGRLAIISFHSLEDRIVKNVYKELSTECLCPPEFPICQCDNQAKIRIVTRKPIGPGLEEIKENPRARSAKLRIIEKI